MAASRKTCSRSGAPSSELLARPLDREADRRQRVLDLVRDPPRRLAPGGDPLRPHELGQVVDDDEPPEVGEARVPQRHDRDEEGADLAAGGEDDPPLAGGVRGGPGRVDRLAQRAQRGVAEELVQGAADRVGRQAEQFLRGAVAGRDRPAGVDGDDAGGDRLEDGLDQVAPALQLEGEPLQLAVGALEVGLARAQVAGHAVERLDEHADLVLGLDGQLEVEIAAGDPARALGQLLDRRRDHAREVEGEPGGREGDDQRDRGQPQRVAQADRAAEEPRLAVALEGRGGPGEAGARDRRGSRGWR